MQIPFMKFTTEKAVDFFKKNWRPGMKEPIYASLYPIVLLLGIALSNSETSQLFGNIRDFVLESVPPAANSPLIASSLEKHP